MPPYSKIMPGSQLQAKVGHWWDTAWLPWDLAVISQAEVDGRVQPLRGLDEWKFIYAMSRIQRNKKKRLPSYLKHYVQALLREVEDVQAPLPLAWLAVHPRGSTVQKQALREVLQAGGTTLAIPPWIENVPPPPPPPPAPTAAAAAPSPPPPAPTTAAAAPSAPAPAPAPTAVTCLGQCSALMATNPAHTGCPLSGILHPQRCTNAPSRQLEYEGKPIEASQPEAVRFLGTTAGRVLVPNWLHLAQTQMQGRVLVCQQCQDNIQRQMRTFSPLDSLKLSIGQLDAVGRQANAWSSMASSALSMADKVGIPGAQQGAEFFQAAAQTATSLTPSLQASKAVTNQLGLRDGLVKDVVQGTIAHKLADLAQGTTSSLPDSASVTGLLQQGTKLLSQMKGGSSSSSQPDTTPEQAFVAAQLQQLRAAARPPGTGRPS